MQPHTSVWAQRGVLKHYLYLTVLRQCNGTKKIRWKEAKRKETMIKKNYFHKANDIDGTQSGILT